MSYEFEEMKQTSTINGLIEILQKAKQEIGGDMPVKVYDRDGEYWPICRISMNDPARGYKAEVIKKMKEEGENMDKTIRISI